MKIAAYPKPAVELLLQPGGGAGAQSKSFAELMGEPQRARPAKTETAGVKVDTGPARAIRPDEVGPDEINPGNPRPASPIASQMPVAAVAAEVGASFPVEAAQMAPQAAGGRTDVEILSRGFQFNELGMFGEFAAIEAPARPLDEPAGTVMAVSHLDAGDGAEQPVPLSFGSEPMNTTVQVGADSGEPPGRDLALVDLAPLSKAPASPVAAQPVAEVEWVDGEPGSETEPTQARSNRDFDAPVERDEPLKIALYDDGAGISLAAAAPLTHAEQTRIWRNIKDYADRLGLSLRTFHLNGWAGDSKIQAWREQNGD